VTIEYLGYIKKKLGVERSEIISLDNKSSVYDLLILLSKKYGDPFRKAVFDPKDLELKPYHMISVNGLLLNQLKGLKTELNGNDQVILMPIVSGG
jgi:molybdopterin converting factor small subunit